MEEYSSDYCEFLELAYGQNTLSEGGTNAIAKMFSGIDVHHKKFLDIGSGLGAAAFFIAEEYNADTVDTFSSALSDAGFSSVKHRDESPNYETYNRGIIANLQSEPTKSLFIEKFGEQDWREAVNCYELIADSIKDRELLITHFVGETQADT